MRFVMGSCRLAPPPVGASTMTVSEDATAFVAASSFLTEPGGDNGGAGGGAGGDAGGGAGGDGCGS